MTAFNAVCAAVMPPVVAVAAVVAAAAIRHRPAHGGHLAIALFLDGGAAGPAVILIMISASAQRYGGNYAADTLFQM